jgi:hypothetical protein
LINKNMAAQKKKRLTPARSPEEPFVDKGN